MSVRSPRAAACMLAVAGILAGVIESTAPALGKRSLAAQQLVLAAGGPRFLYASAKTARPVEVDVSRTTVLRQRITLNLEKPTVSSLLEAIAAQTGLEFVYSREVVPVNRTVALYADSITVAAALTEILVDTGLDVILSPGRQVVLTERRTLLQGRYTGSVAGQVTDSATGRGVSGAEVYLEKTKWRTTTDTAGRYRIREIEAGEYLLTVRRVGYAKHTEAITVEDGETETVDVVMAPQATRLTELVTTATGRQRRMDIANDVTTIDADSVMQAAPITSVTDLLEGRVPGLTVQRTSGAPGDPARLRLRGPGSPLRNNDPIVIVDGIRVYAEQSSARNTNLAGISDTTEAADAVSYATPSPLDYIDPNSIETIEVLKGPSAATLYGQDAANGVIVITTKRGQAGAPRWVARANYGRTEMVGDYPELVLRFGENIFTGDPVLCPISNQVQMGSNSFACDGDSVPTFQLLNDPGLTMLGRGHNAEASLTVSGGSSALTYAVTGRYRNDIGLPRLPAYEADRYQALVGSAPPDWMQRPQNLTAWGVSSNLRAHLGPAATLSFTTSFSRTSQQRSSLERQIDDLMSTYLDRASGTYYRLATSGTALTGPIAEVTDDILTSYHERARAVAADFRNGVNLDWRPKGWLTVRADAGLNIQQRSDEVFLPTMELATGDTTVGEVSYGQGTVIQSTVNAGAVAVAPLGGMRFRFAAGVNYAGRSINDASTQTVGLAPGTSVKGATITSSLRNLSDDATFGWYVEPSLSHPRFSLSLGMRFDGGTSYGASIPTISFPPKFPKLGFTYLLSDESFYPLKDIVPVFRVRLAYGRASRQPGITDELRLYSETQSLYGDGQFAPGVELLTLGNTEIRPERSTAYEGGFDAELLDARLHVSFTGYRKTTDDALLNVPLPPSIYGAGVSIIKNIGVTRNAGLEVAVGGQFVRSPLMTWGAELQFSQRRDVVVALAPGVEPFYTASDIRVAPGYPLFGRWSKPILGYADADGDGVLREDEIQMGDTAVYVGSTVPNYTSSLHTTWALWDNTVAVSAGFTYDDGLSQKNEVARRLAPFSYGRNVPGASIEEQIAVADLRTGATELSTYNRIQTVSTLRFNSLSVRYRVPEAIARRLGAQRFDLSVQGSNLGLWTNYRGLDPSVNAFSTGNNVTDTGVLPRARTWRIQVNATY